MCTPKISRSFVIAGRDRGTEPGLHLRMHPSFFGPSVLEPYHGLRWIVNVSVCCFNFFGRYCGSLCCRSARCDDSVRIHYLNRWEIVCALSQILRLAMIASYKADGFHIDANHSAAWIRVAVA